MSAHKGTVSDSFMIDLEVGHTVSLVVRDKKSFYKKVRPVGSFRGLGYVKLPQKPEELKRVINIESLQPSMS